MKISNPKNWFGRLLSLLGIGNGDDDGPARNSDEQPEQNPENYHATEGKFAGSKVGEPALTGALQDTGSQEIGERAPPINENAQGIESQIEVTRPNEQADGSENVAVPVPFVAIDDEARRRLRDVRKYASWSGEDGQTNLMGLVATFNETYPGNERAIDAAIAEGKADRELYEQAYKMAARGDASRDEVEKLRRDAKRRSANLNKIEDQFQKGDAAFQRRRNSKARSRSGTQLSNVKPRSKDTPTKSFPLDSLVARRGAPQPPAGMHANDLRALSPARNWRVFVDETGSEFGVDAGAAESRRLGRFVALVMEGTKEPLKPLKTGWHAADCTDDAEIDYVVQAALDADVGILGICVTGLPVTPGERWADGVSLLIDWIVRLLPMSEPTLSTRIEVLVERRGIFGAGQSWELVARESLRRLALAFPQRAAFLDLTIALIGKDGSPLNGYVDALAFTWAGATETSRERLNRSNLRGTCLLEQDAREMLHAWDAFAQGVNLPPHLWWELVASSNAQNPSSILSSFLDLVGAECRADHRRWSVFLSHSRQQMAMGPVDLRHLSAAVNWLQHFQPADSVIPPLLRLSWLTVQLAKANHMGLAESEWGAELRRLTPGLIEEAAPIVCQADLHLAVARTNRFEFESARETLKRWRNYPPAVPGLQCWGQILSSLGQHAAFLGDATEAIKMFDQSLETFDRLSDPFVREKEVAQTACYRAIAIMDDRGQSLPETRAAVEKLLGPFPAAVKSLAVAEDPALRYAHHLLLRWLTHRGDPEIRKAYLDRRADWKAGEGHPWPLIQLYRGLLLEPDDRAAARELALDAAGIAFSAGQGPVVRLIGACCRAIASSLGAPWPDAETEITRLRSALPSATDRLDGLSDWLGAPTDPLALLQTVLPFNFR